MKIKHLLIVIFLFTCANAHAEWFLRGTQNGWGNTQMAVGGTNTMQLNNVVFTSVGSIKFDRFGDWKENYGVGGKNGTNISVAAGTWTIKFFTDTKNWSITAASVLSSSKASSSSSNSSKVSSSVASSSKASSSLIVSSSSKVSSSSRISSSSIKSSSSASSIKSSSKSSVRVSSLSGSSVSSLRASSSIVSSTSSSTVSSQGSSISNVVSKVDFIEPFGIALDVVRNRALVVDIGLQAVIAVDLTSGKRVILSDNSQPNSVNGFSGPRGIALDLAHNRALIADSDLAAVIAVNLTTGARTVLTSNSMPNQTDTIAFPLAIALDVLNNRALVTDGGNDSIFSVDLTTGVRKTLSKFAFNQPVLINAFGISYDSLRNRALVVCRDRAVIAVDLTTGKRTFLTDENPPMGVDELNTPLGITLDTVNNRALIADGGVNSVFAVNLASGSHSVLSGNGIPNDENNMLGPISIDLDSAHNRVLVVDMMLKAVVGVDLTTGERTILSSNASDSSGISSASSVASSQSSQTIFSQPSSAANSSWMNNVSSSSVASSWQPMFSSSSAISSVDFISSSTPSWWSSSSSTKSSTPISNESSSAFSFTSSSANSIYFVRGTQSGWDADTLMNRINSSDSYQRCVFFPRSDIWTTPQFKIATANWIESYPEANNFNVQQGWVNITFNGITHEINVQENLPENCGLVSSSSSDSSASESSSSSSRLSKSSVKAISSVASSKSSSSDLSQWPSISSVPSKVDFVRPISIALDAQNNRALVLDRGLDAVIAVNLSNGERTVFSDNNSMPNSLNSFQSPETIVLDSIRNRVLVSDGFSGDGKIIAIDLTDGSRSVLSNNNIPNASNTLNCPDGLAMDLINNRVLVTDWCQQAVLGVDLSTGERTIVGNASDLLNSPIDIALDTAHNRALVPSNSASRVIAVDLAIGVSTVFATTQFSPQGIVLDTANNRALIMTSAGLGRKISSFDLTTGSSSSFSPVTLSGTDAGIALDSANNRVLVVDSGFKALVAVDLTTGEPLVISANTPKSSESSSTSSQSSTAANSSWMNNVSSSSAGSVASSQSWQTPSSSSNSSLQAFCIPHCSSASSSSNTVYHLRGTQTNPRFIEGDLFSPVAGSTTNFEICRNLTAGTATSPARFKVDPNGGWGDGFPATDFPAKGWTHIVINGAEKKILSVTENMAANCGITSSSISSVSSAISSSSSSSKISSSIAANDFRARTTYFIFVDRFSNGDASNDNGLNPMGTIVGDVTDPLHLKSPISQWKKYWGGDIQGIINKLDYLQALGITAIWVTPMVDNVNDTGIEGTYHGYQARDFYEVDEHLGDWALVDKLNEEMEKRNMKLVLDITLNYSNNINMGEFGDLFKEGIEIVKNFDAGKSDWYHNNGTMADCGDTNPLTTCNDEWNDLNKARNKMLFDLADFNHGVSSNSKADEYLIGAAKKWMQHGVDAFRIDAIKHIEPSFINRFATAVRAEAAAEGKAEPYIFGEWYGAGAEDVSSMQFLNERRGSELADFGLRDNIEVSIAGNRSMKALSAHIELRQSVMNGKDNWQAIFLDNHDAQRTSVYLQTTSNTNRGVGRGMVKAEADARQNLGMALVMTLPGVPVIYYGTEQNTAVLTLAAENNQIGSDPFNREMMPSFDQTTPAFKLISALAALRQDSVAIQNGSYKQVLVNDNVLIFQRQQGNDCAVVAVNNGPATSIDVEGLCLPDSLYSNLAGNDVVNVAADKAKFTLPHNGIVVLH